MKLLLYQFSVVGARAHVRIYIYIRVGVESGRDSLSPSSPAFPLSFVFSYNSRLSIPRVRVLSRVVFLGPSSGTGCAFHTGGCPVLDAQGTRPRARAHRMNMGGIVHTQPVVCRDTKDSFRDCGRNFAAVTDELLSARSLVSSCLISPPLSPLPPSSPCSPVL